MTRSAALFGILLATLAGAQTTGKVTAVRVYRGQALVTRQIQVETTAGSQSVTVNGLPARIIGESLYASGEAGVAVRAVRFRADATADAPRPEVRALDEQIETKQATMEEIQAQSQVVAKHEAYLDKLENFVAPAATGDLNRGVLDAEALIQLTRFALEQRGELAERKLELSGRGKQVQEELQVLLRQRQALLAGGPSADLTAVVFFDATAAGRTTLELHYLVGGVDWSPAYLARLNGARNQLSLEYHAAVTQASGEDWDEVELVLSTSFANMQADAPLLAPFYVALASADEAMANQPASAKEYAQRRSEIEDQLRTQQNAKPSVGGLRGPAGERGEGGSGGRRLDSPTALPTAGEAIDLAEANVLAAELQNLELTATPEAIRGARRTDAREGLAVDYPLPGRISLASRADQQMFRIAAIQTVPQFYYTAVPLLSDFVYRSIEARNTSEQALLAGPYSAYVDGVFAGRGHLPTTASGQSFTLGFGTESSLKVSRELEDKQTEIRGGNKLLRYNYRIRLQNFLAQPATVRVWDRIPQAPRADVAVSLTDPGPALSDDPLYQSQLRGRGVLRWDITVPPGAAGAEAAGFTYGFQLEFDKSYDIGALQPELEEKMRRDLEVMMTQ